MTAKHKGELLPGPAARVQFSTGLTSRWATGLQPVCVRRRRLISAACRKQGSRAFFSVACVHVYRAGKVPRALFRLHARFLFGVGAGPEKRTATHAQFPATRAQFPATRAQSQFPYVGRFGTRVFWVARTFFAFVGSSQVVVLDVHRP